MAKKQKYFLVDMTCLAVVYQQVRVRATDAEAAEKKALAEHATEKDGKHFPANDAGWEFNGTYNDGKPHSELSVNEVAEDDDQDD